MPIKLFSFPSVLIAIAIIAGCAGTPKQQVLTEETTTEAAPTVAVKPFPTETLYQLLVGELAGVRNQPKLALQYYMAQALETRDPQITARATSIAAYVKALPELLQTAALWVELEPENPQANQLYAFALIQDKQFLQAFPHAAFALEHGNQEPLLTLAAYSESASPDTLQQLLNKYADLQLENPDNIYLAQGKAMLLQQLQRPGEALAEIEPIQRRHPDNEVAALMTAQLLHQLNQPKKALKSLKKSLDINPKSKRLRLQYARFLAKNDLFAAHRHLSILAEQFPNDSQLHFSMAMASQQLGLKDQARSTLLRLTKNPASSADAHFQLALMAEQEEDITQALIHYRQVRNGKNFIAAANKVGQILVQTGQLDAAQLYLQKLRLEQPSQSVLLYQVESELLLDQKQLGDAYRILSEALSLHPENISLLYTRSMVSEQNNNFDYAEKDLRAILKKDQNNATALNALGYTMTLHTNRYQEAHELIVRALEIEPEDPAIIDSLGWVLYHLGRYEESIEQLRLAMSKLPDPEVAAHLGEVLWVTNQKEEARKVWQQILDTDPDNEIVLETVRRLRGSQ